MPSEPQGIAIDQQELYRKVDFAVFTLANLMNIILVIIFLNNFYLIYKTNHYILQINFRSTRLLGPYLLLYYLAILGMIGYSFQIGKTYGFITLLTYFINQIATFYSYFRVGHG